MSQKAFTLIELLVVITIMAILLVVVYLLINPTEFVKRSRDAGRLSELASMRAAINVAVQEATSSSAMVLCVGSTAPCNGVSSDSSATSRKTDGNGWMKVNVSSTKSVSLPTLPVDPLNSGVYVYRYASDGDTWEIDTTLESQQQSGKMATDGGNCDTKYEVGSNLTLLGC